MSTQEPAEEKAVKPEGTVVPPYVPFSTLIGLLNRMVATGVPNRVDRSYLTGMSGGYQSQVLAALRALRWIKDETGEPTSALQQLVAHPDDWPAKLSSQVYWLYSDQIALADDNATQGTLEDSFRRSFGLTGSTLRKAIKFFLDISDFVGLPRSPHWRVPTKSASRSKSAGKRQPRRQAVKTAGVPGVPSESGPQGRGSQVVTLRSGGSVVLSMSVDLFALSESDRQFVFDLIDRMRDYDLASPRRTDPGGDT